MRNPILISFLEVPVHISINKAENNGFIAHQSLVVAFAIRDGTLVRTAILYFPEYGTGLPILVRLFLDCLNPEVGNVHCHAVIKTISAIIYTCSEAWHATNLFGNSNSLGVNLVY